MHETGRSFCHLCDPHQQDNDTKSLAAGVPHTPASCIHRAREDSRRSISNVRERCKSHQDLLAFSRGCLMLGRVQTATGTSCICHTPAFFHDKSICVATCESDNGHRRQLFAELPGFLKRSLKGAALIIRKIGVSCCHGDVVIYVRHQLRSQPKLLCCSHLFAFRSDWVRRFRESIKLGLLPAQPRASQTHLVATRLFWIARYSLGQFMGSVRVFIRSSFNYEATPHCYCTITS